MEPMVFALAGMLGGPLLGVLLLWRAARRDHATWVMARAPGLPIRALAVGDDAWLRGRVVCAEPLAVPYFGGQVVAFEYRRERKHTRTVRDKNGKTETRTEWRTEVDRNGAVDFQLDDGSRVLVRVDGAENEAFADLATDYERSDLRHVARVVEVGAELSVLGVTQPGGVFAAEAEVPLLLTREPRERRVARSSRSETTLFVIGLVLTLLGVGGGVATLLLVGAPVAERPWRIAAAVGAGFAAVLPLWWIGAWNRLVRLKQQVAAAFRQVDVDLAVRAGLVPNLVAVVQAYAGHERELLAALTSIRAGGGPQAVVAGEAAAQATARTVLTLHERYPALRADAVYRDLHERLWALEEKLAHTRRLYSDVVAEWNTRCARFPEGLVARVMRARPAPPFAGDDAPLPPRLIG